MSLKKHIVSVFGVDPKPEERKVFADLFVQELQRIMLSKIFLLISLSGEN